MANLDNVEVELRTRVQGVMMDAGKFWVTTGHRSSEEQQRLWDLWQAAIKHYGSEAAARRHNVATAARPGQSKHELNPAQAVDLACTTNDNDKRAALAKRWGLHTPITGEPWHMELDPKRHAIPKPLVPTLPPTLSEASRMIAKPAVKIALTTNGYYIFAADGGVFCFGDAVFFGSAAGVELSAPINDACVTPTGRGYYLLGADGGLFMYGDAQAHPLPDGRFNAVGLVK